MTTVTPMPDYILISIKKQDQKDRKFKIGNIFLPEQLIFMTRNCQAGIIIKIGERAKKNVPGAEAGDILLCHHFVESVTKPYHIDQDDENNYYVVPSMRTNMNLCYGYWDGNKIIPHPDFVFLEVEKKDQQVMAVTKGGILTFQNWEVSREDNELKMNRLKAEAQELAKTGPTRPDVKLAIEQKEAEMSKISKLINKKVSIQKKLIYAHPELSEQLGVELKLGDILYCANYACHTQLEFQENSYVVCKTEHVDGLLRNV